MDTMPTTTTFINDKIEIAKKGIWTRANATANPKAYIIKAGYMKDGEHEVVYPYNMALTAAKKWAKA